MDAFNLSLYCIFSSELCEWWFGTVFFYHLWEAPNTNIGSENASAKWCNVAKLCFLDESWPIGTQCPLSKTYVPLLSFTILRPHMIKLAASGATDRIGACSPVWPQRLLCFSILCCHCCLGSQIGLAVMLSHEVLSSLGKQLHSNRAVEVLKQMEQRKLRTDVPWTKIFKVWMFRCSFLGKKWSAGIPKWFLKLIFFCRSKLWLWLDLCDAHLLVVGHVFSVFFRGLP